MATKRPPIHGYDHAPDGPDPAPFSNTPYQFRDSIWIQTHLTTFTKNVDHTVDWNANDVQTVWGGYPGIDSGLDGTYSGGTSLTGRSYTFDNTTSPSSYPITVKTPGIYIVAASLQMGTPSAFDNPFYMGIKDGGGIANIETFVNREYQKSQRFDTNDAFGSPFPGDPIMWKVELMGFGDLGTYGLTVRHTNSNDPAGPTAAIVTVNIIRLLGADP